MDIEKLALDTNEEMESEINSVLSEENKLTPGNANSKGSILDESDILLFQKELNSKASSDDTSILSTNKKLLSQDAKDILSEIENKNSVIPEQARPSLSFSEKAELPETKKTSYEIKSMPLEISVEQPKEIMTESAKIQTAPTVENVVRTHSEIISQQIKDQIIDRILVSTNDLELNKTVKIVINPSLLENTQVNFQKMGQILSIQFETINANSLQFLKANQIDLQLYLQQNLKQFQDVSVCVKGSSQSFEQPQDGRSRNRYEYENLDDEEQ